MDEAQLLSLVTGHPHPAALARHVQDSSLFVVLRRLEACGLVVRRRGLYRVTRHGQRELELARAIAWLTARTRLNSVRSRPA
jgi:DNA-binding PadR family transcriptional regulator